MVFIFDIGCRSNIFNRNSIQISVKKIPQGIWIIKEMFAYKYSSTVCDSM